MVASYLELYEEGEVELSTVYGQFSCSNSYNYVMTLTSGGVVSLRVSVKKDVQKAYNTVWRSMVKIVGAWCAGEDVESHKGNV